MVEPSLIFRSSGVSVYYISQALPQSCRLARWAGGGLWEKRERTCSSKQALNVGSEICGKLAYIVLNFMIQGNVEP